MQFNFLALPKDFYKLLNSSETIFLWFTYMFFILLKKDINYYFRFEFIIKGN